MFSQKIKISNSILSENNQSLIIAEIGSNHEGSKERCIKMIDQAYASGADIVKLQYSNPASNYARNTSSYKVFTKSQLKKEDIFNIYNYAKKKNIKIFSTFDRESLDFFKILKPICFKISSSLFYDYHFIKEILKENKPVIISGGVADIKDVDLLFNLIKKQKNKKIIFLHSRSLYPASLNKLNLSRISFIKNHYKILVGYSDHYKGISASIAAINFGAKIIEKHFSLDPKKSGFDNNVSVDPKRFKKMVRLIRENEEMRGKYDYKISDNDSDFKKIKSVIRSYISKVELKKNLSIDLNNIYLMRLKNQNNFSQFYKIMPKILSKKLKRNIIENHILKLKDFN